MLHTVHRSWSLKNEKQSEYLGPVHGLRGKKKKVKYCSQVAIEYWVLENQPRKKAAKNATCAIDHMPPTCETVTHFLVIVPIWGSKGALASAKPYQEQNVSTIHTHPHLSTTSCTNPSKYQPRRQHSKVHFLVNWSTIWFRVVILHTKCVVGPSWVRAWCITDTRSDVSCHVGKTVLITPIKTDLIRFVRETFQTTKPWYNTGTDHIPVHFSQLRHFVQSES